MVATPGIPLHQVARLAVTWSMVLSGPSPVCPLPVTVPCGQGKTGAFKSTILSLEKEAGGIFNAVIFNY